RFEHSITVTVRGRHQVDGRTRQRSDMEEDVAGLGRQTCEATPEQLTQALWYAQRAPSRGLHPRLRQLAGQFEREERIPSRRLLKRGELGRRQPERQPLLEQVMQRA